MPVVTEHLVQLLARQVDDKGLVVWYDPEQAYGSAAAELKLPKTTIARFEGSFFQLRQEIDHLLNDGQPPRLVVYVPMEREKTYAALIELDSAGVVMQPRQQPPACNTRLSVLARNALKPLLGEDQVGEIEKQVDAGKLTLADLDALAAKGKDLSTGVLALLFGSANPQEVALAFLHNDRFDKDIDKREAAKELRHLLETSFELGVLATENLNQLRVRLGRHVLLTDWFAALKKHWPPSLGSVPVAQGMAGIDACVRLARTWRNSREYRDSYVEAARQTERELALDRVVIPVDSLLENETFLCGEHVLLAHVEGALLQAATSGLADLAKRRLSRFWADVEPKIQARWALITTAAEVLLEADRVGKEIKNPPATVGELVKAYASDDEPWCLLDTHHRRLESRKYHFDFATDDGHQGLEKLIAKAERRYNEVGGALSKQFISQFGKAKHPIKGLLQQREIFEKAVKPHLGESKVAYVWVDALRFEMARELGRLLADDFTLECHPALGTVPTITEIGMAALLPRAHEGFKVVGVGGGKLAVEISGKLVKDRRDRVAFLKEQAGVSVFDAKLDDLLPKPIKRVKEGIQNHQLILVTSQEIDELGEADNTAQARLQIDGVLSQLRRGLRVLADHGVKTIVLVADHGHLFGEEIGEDMKIESPGGKVEDLHRRVWVGVGGNAESSYFRTSLTSLGVESEYDLATPWTFAIFKSKGGGRAYFHGGLSPQELIVPVVVLHSKVKSSKPTEGIHWTLRPGTPKLTTRFFSVQISGTQGESGLFDWEPPKVRIEIRANKKCVSVPVSASYGFEDATGEVKLKVSETDKNRMEPNTITMMVVPEEITQKTVGVYLLDATTGAELANPLTVDVAISM